MKKTNNTSGLKRLVAYALVLAMLLTLMPVSAFAKRAPKLRLPEIDPAAAEAPAEAPEAAEEPAAAEAPETPEEPAEPEAPEAPEEAAEPEAPEEPAEPESPAIVQELKVGKLTVSVNAEPGAFPEGTKVKAKKADLKKVQKSIDEAKDVDGKVLVAVDITFTLKGKELQPAEGKTVKVEINAPELKDKAKEAAVVHIDGETQKPELVAEVEATEEEDGVTFDADSFSIYAVVEPGSTLPEARATVNFYGYNNQLVATYYVKNSDDDDQLEINVIDPGIGDLGAMSDQILFRGWSMDDVMNSAGERYTDSETYVGAGYSTTFNAMNIEDIRSFLKDLTIHEGDILNIYAVLYEYYYVTYYGEYKEESELQPGEQNVALGKKTVYRLVGQTDADYVVNMGFSTEETNRNFKGWIPIEGAANVTPGLDDTKLFYENGEAVTISGDVTFVAEAPYGYWLVYHANGKGATYNAPQFYEGYEGEDPTTYPATNATADKMFRKGYNFVGWYPSKTVTDPETGEEVLVMDDSGEQFQFYQPITEDTDIFAKWEEKTQAPYTVVCWTERLEPGPNGELYDIADTQVFNDGAAGQNIPYEVVENGSEDYATGVGSKVIDGETIAKGHYTGFCLRDDCKNLEVEITIDGEAILNLYFDRIEYNFRFYLYRQTGSASTHQEYVPYTGTPSNREHQYGLQNGQYIDVWWRNSAWRLSNSNSGTVYSYNNDGVYTIAEVPDEGSFTPNANGCTYANNSSGGRELNDLVTWHNASSDHPTLSSAYEDAHPLAYEDFTFGTTTYRYYYFTITAKYGADISDQWPRYDTDIIGVDSRVPVSYVMMVGTKLKPNPSSSGDGTVKGIITVLNENILGKTDDPDGNYVIVRFPTSHYEWRYHIWFEAVDGKDVDGQPISSDTPTQTYNGKTYYQADILEVRSSNTQISSQNEPKYDGYDFQGKKGEDWSAGTVNYWTTSSNPTLYHLNYLYDRQKFKITFMDGQYVNGNGENVDNKAHVLLGDTEEIILGSDISAYETYNKDEATKGTFQPTEPGYVFVGWYLNENCTQPYDFTTMPNGGVRVFAKWQEIQYRVFLHSNATLLKNGQYVHDLSLSWGDENMPQDEKQKTAFRVSYGEMVSTPAGTREGYLFRGWYTDPALTQVYSAKTELNEQTVKTAYNKSVDMTDVLDKFGDIVPVGGDYYLSNNPVEINQTAPYNSDDEDHNDRWWITEKLELYAKWQQILKGAKGVTVVYDAVDGKGKFADNLVEHTDPMLYEDNSDAVVGPASVSTVEGQQFRYWVVQRWDGEGYVDARDAEGELVLAYPGDNVRVLASYAKITNTETGAVVAPNAVVEGVDYTYTMVMRAEYGPNEVPKDTYFNWYRNWEGDTDVAVDTARLHHDDDLQINEHVDIFTLTEGIPEREGYIFLGWARQNEFATDEIVYDENGRPTNDPVLYYEDPALYIKWVAEEGQYYVEDSLGSGNWTVKVSQAAADEELPYQAFYAVREKIPTFKVVYASDVTLGGSNDALTGTVSSDKIYEFYLEDFRSADDASKPFLDVVYGMADAETVDGQTGVLKNVYDNYLYGGYRFASEGEDGTLSIGEYGTVAGTQIIPEANVVYYVKDVDPNYLAPYYKYTYVKKDRLVTGLWSISVLDDLNYDDAGFVVWDVFYNTANSTETLMQSDEALPFPIENGYSTLTVKSYHNKEGQEPVVASSVTVTPTDLYANAGSGSKLIYVGIEDIFGDEFVDQIRANRYKAQFSAVPYWVTFDGIPVLARKYRTITVHPSKILNTRASEVALTPDHTDGSFYNFLLSAFED